jgi:hypothetical protein
MRHANSGELLFAVLGEGAGEHRTGALQYPPGPFVGLLSRADQHVVGHVGEELVADQHDRRQ